MSHEPLHFPYPHRVLPYYPAYRIPAPMQGFGGAQGLGYDLWITTPVGKQKVSIPIEEMAKNAAGVAIDAALPIMLPKLRSAIDKEIPHAVDVAWNAAQPKIRSEIDRTIDMATYRAAMIGTGIAVVVIGAAMWIRAGVKKRG